MIKCIAATTAAAALVVIGSVAAYAAETPVYMEAVSAGTTLTALATAGDKFGNYYLPGVPDGLGAYMQGSNVKVLMNHEISASGIAGTITRANGKTTGTTITEFTIDPLTGKVITAKEAIKKVSFHSYKTSKFSTKASVAKWRADDSKKNRRSLCHGRPVIMRWLSTSTRASVLESAVFRTP